MGGILALTAPVAILTYPFWAGGEPANTFFAPTRMLVLLWLCVALPGIHGWSHNKSWDRAVGELSYPLYLGQLLVLGVVGGVPMLAGHTVLRTLAVAAASLGLAQLTVRFVERRIEAFRRMLAFKARVRAGVGADAA